MRAPTRLFVALLVGAVVVVAAVVWRQAGPGGNLTRPKDATVRIISALPAEPWVTAAAKAYNAEKHEVAGARVTVEVVPMDGITALNRWAKNDFDTIPTVWLAETRDWVNQANNLVVESRGQDIFLAGGEYRDQPVALSPQVWAIFKSRYDALKSFYASSQDPKLKLNGKDLGWWQINNAAVVGDWTKLGGKAEWGRFKLVVPHPKRDPAGLAAMVGAAGAYYNRASVTTDDLTNAGFQKWLQESMDSVVDFSPFGVENMLLFGYSNGDAGQIIESYLLVNMEGLQKRWKEPLAILYPDPITWFDFPYAIYMGKETSALEKNAALDFKRYLLSDAQQQSTLKFGLRPASPDVATQSPESLIARWSAMGFKEEVPSTSRMRPAPRSGVTSLAEWFQKRYEQ
ncbi:MAG: substrate-binding domain-containing protein [Chloroflexota bacterium]